VSAEHIFAVVLGRPRAVSVREAAGAGRALPTILRTVFAELGDRFAMPVSTAPANPTHGAGVVAAVGSH
jgi:hypothetical protein